MANPEAGSVEERVTAARDKGRADQAKGNPQIKAVFVPIDDLDALLGVVEAAQLVRNEPWFKVRSEGSAKFLIDALAALQSPDPAEHA